jgi:hypothetical protein
MAVVTVNGQKPKTNIPSATVPSLVTIVVQPPQGNQLCTHATAGGQGASVGPSAGPAEGSEADAAAVGAGVALADASLAVSGEATEGFRVPGVNLGAFRVLGGVTTFAGAAITTYGGFQNIRSGNYAGLALNGADLTVTTAGLLAPPTLPFAIGYGIGRGLGDLAAAISEIGKPDILERAAAPSSNDALSRAILSGLHGCN